VSRGADSEIRERCPRCRLTDINKRLDETYRCKRCANVFLTPIVGTKTMREKTTGRVAGKIVIGRGTRWGAGY
jgi:transposase-like protein